MAGTPLTHNTLSGVTAGVWREHDAIRKRLTRRTDAPPHWAASEDPHHWNYWRREALVYEAELPQRLGLAAPRLLDIAEAIDGDIELRLEDVAGRHGAELGIADLEAAALTLGRSQGRADQLGEPWLSRRFLRDYSTTRHVRWELLDDDAAWAQPLIREHFPPAIREGLLRLRARRERLLDLMERLPRTVCHLDVWQNNLIRRPDGEIVLIDWAFVGDGALGEDVGNLVPDSVFDLLLPHAALDELDARATAAYLAGLRDANWRGDERLVRLGICASAVKYEWLAIRCLEDGSSDELLDYGRAGPVDADAILAARAAGLGLCARWADEAERLAEALGL